MLHAVREKFGLNATEAETLIGLAEEEARDATDYYQFTSLINRHFSAGAAATGDRADVASGLCRCRAERP